MLKIEHTNVYGWEEAIRGMRNPMNSWDKSDSDWDLVEDPSLINPNDTIEWVIGKNDYELMMKLAKGGSTHAKYRRMLTVTCDITAPLYWWKEFDTYKVGTVANSCSTMHKIHDKEFTKADFSCEKLTDNSVAIHGFSSWDVLGIVVQSLNHNRERYLATKNKRYWWQMIQLLPSSYNQRRTVQLNYEVLVGIYRDRRNHKLDEWVDFCNWICKLPYSELIKGE